MAHQHLVRRGVASIHAEGGRVEAEELLYPSHHGNVFAAHAPDHRGANLLIAAPEQEALAAHHAHDDARGTFVKERQETPLVGVGGDQTAVLEHVHAQQRDTTVEWGNLLALPVGDLYPDLASAYRAVMGGWQSINGYSGYEPGYYEALRTLSERSGVPMAFSPSILTSNVQFGVAPSWSDFFLARETRFVNMLNRKCGLIWLARGARVRTAAIWIGCMAIPAVFWYARNLVTALRTRAVSAERKGRADEVASAEARLEQAVERLFAVAEAYPDLKADARFRDLAHELAATENKIAFSRQLYNDTVTAYRTATQRFPLALVARPLRFEPPPLFAAEGAERGPVGVDLDGS